MDCVRSCLVVVSFVAPFLLGCAPAPTRPRLPIPRLPHPPEASHEDLDPARVGPVSLDALLAWAHHHAPALVSARAGLAIGRAEMEGARAPALGPTEVEIEAGIRQGAAGSDPALAASVRQPFEISGARDARIAAAQMGVHAGRADVALAEWEVHRAIHAAFYDALVAQETKRITERAAAFTARIAEFVQRRVAAGESSPIEQRVAEGESAQATQEAVAAAGRFLEARVALAAECGWPTDHPPEPEGILSEPHDPPALGALVARALRDQAAIARAAIAVEHARAHVTAANRDRWPMAALGVTVAREEGSDIYLGTLGVGLPLFAANQAERARARAEVEVAGAELAALRMTVPARIARAHVAVSTAVERVRAYGTRIIPQFEETLGLLERALQLGEIDVLELSVASRRLLEVQREALGARADYHRALAELEAAVGAELDEGGAE